MSALFVLLAFALALAALCFVVRVVGHVQQARTTNRINRALENLRVDHPGYPLPGDELEEDFYMAEKELEEDFYRAEKELNHNKGAR